MRRILVVFCVSCAAPVVCPRPATLPPPPPHVEPARAPGVTPLHIEVTSDDKIENCLHVKLHFTGKLASSTELKFAPSHAVTMSAAAASDGQGAVGVTQGEHALTVVAAERRELHVEYTLKFAPSGLAGAPFSESIELQVAGEDLFALPSSDEKIDVSLDIKTGNLVTGGASSFGLGHVRKFHVRLEDLRGAFFLGGDVGTAEFHAGDGDDITAWIGHTAFDPRWIGAEVAATRAAVDLYVNRQHAGNSPPLAFLIVPTKRDDLPVVMMPRTRGFLVSVDRRAVWNAQARILVGQALAQRYVGGFVSLGPRDSELAGLWSEGFSRAIGREVVFDMGMIEAADRAAEVNQLLFAETFATEPKRKISTRGALIATALGPTLRNFTRERLQDAAQAKSDRIDPQAFRDKVGSSLFEAREIPLPADLLGKCWRLERKTLVPFELGFVTSAGEELRITSVVPKSRAEAAGVRMGDVIEKLDYRPGQADSPVKLKLRRTTAEGRGDTSISLGFVPAGIGKPGRAFVRVPGIPDDRC